MFEWTFGSFEIIFLGILITFFYHSVIKGMTDAKTLKKIEKFVLYAFAVRLFWYFVYLGFIADGYPFMVSDDYSYYYTAARNYLNLEEGRNNYQTFLTYLYHFFGVSSLNGRIVNLFASALTTYPIAYLDRTINGDRGRFLATKFYCFVPYMVVISSFEIKDILTMLFFISACAVMQNMILGKAEHKWILLALFCFLTEWMRNGMGLLIVVSYIGGMLLKHFGKERDHKALWKLFGVIFLVFLAVLSIEFLISTAYFQEISELLELYMLGRDEMISSGSFFDFLTIHSIGEIWKVPLDLVFFIVLPNASENTGRFLLDLGIFFRVFDVPVSILGIYWLVRKFSEFGMLAICVLVPYCYLACFQIVAYREVIFILPLIYIAAFHALLESQRSRINVKLSRKVKISFRSFAVCIMYLVWGMYVFGKIA